MHKVCKLGHRFLAPTVHITKFQNVLSNLPIQCYSSENGSIFNPTEIEYTTENWNLIKQYTNMSYHELLAESQKHSSRPKSRSRDTIMKFLIESVPKKENKDETETKEYSRPDAQNIKSFADYLNTGYENEIREVQTILRESEIFNQLSLHPYEQSHALSGIGDNWTSPYIESYERPHLEKTIFKMRFLEARREIEIFLHRSGYLKSPYLVQKSRKTEKNQLDTLFYNLVLLEHEYRSNHKSPISDLVGLLNSKRLPPLVALDFLRYVDQPTNSWFFMNYLKNSPKDMLKPMWNVMFGALEHFDLAALDLILRYVTTLKLSFRMEFSDNESQALENISIAVTRIILDNRENYSLATLCSIISLLKQNKGMFTNLVESNIPIAQEQIVEKYKQDYLGKEKAHNKLTNKEAFDILMGLLNIKDIPNIEECREDFYPKIADKGLKNFDKQLIFKILIALSNNRIMLAPKLAEQIIANTKITEGLSLLEIYLLFHNFTESKQQLNTIYMRLFYAFFNSIEDKFALNDSKAIMLVARIINFILENYLGEHRKQILEKRCLGVLNLLEKSVELSGDRLNPIDIVEISTIFINHINIPDFLFRHINKNIDTLKITNENRTKMHKFVTKYLNKIQPKFTFNVFAGFDQSELNDKITIDALNLFRKLMFKFKDTNLFSYLILNVQIMNNKNFFDLIFSVPEQQKKFIESIVKQLLGIAANVETISLANAFNIVKFMDLYKESIIPNLNVALHQKFLNAFFNLYKKHSELSFNAFIPWLYYQSHSISQMLHKDLNAINSKQQNLLVSKLKKFVTENIIPNFCENSKIAVQQIIYDENVVQFFNSNVFNTNFQNLEYLLPLIDTLDIKRSPLLISNIALQLPRCVKRWDGEFLLQNLLLLDKFEIDCPEFFNMASQNIFSFFVFYQDTQQLVMNPLIIDDQIIMRILRAYINQKTKKFGKFKLNQGEAVTELEIPEESLITVCALAGRVFFKLTQPEIFNIIEILGANRKNYTQNFIKQFSEMEVVANLDKALKAQAMMPAFLMNSSIQDIINDKLFREVNTADPVQVFKILERDNMWIDSPLKPLLGKIWKENAALKTSLLSQVLKYLAINCQQGHYLKEILVNIKDKKLSDFSESDLLHIMAINASNNIQLQASGTPRSSEKFVKDTSIAKQFNQNMKAIVEKIMKSEFFSYFENVTVIDGQTFRIPYFRSFYFEELSKSIPYKVFVRNKSSLGQLYDSWTPAELVNQSDQLSLSSTNQNLDQNFFEVPRHIVDHQLHAEYQDAALKYHLYQYYRQHLPELPFQNEIILSDFISLQTKVFNMTKFTENYANFLIDMTLILHELDLLYKTNFLCEQSKVLIDIAIIEKKIAVIFVNQLSTVKVSDDSGRLVPVPNNIQTLKGNSLTELGGWKVIHVVEEDWCAPNKRREDNEAFVRREVERLG